MSDPFQHPWLGGLFADPEIAAILSAEAELARMLAIEAAWTRALGQATGAKAATIDRVARHIERCAIAPADLRAGTAQDGIPVPSLVRRLNDGLSAGDAALVHRGLTSQDVMDTATVLAMGAVLDVLHRRSGQVLDALNSLKASSGARHLMGHTRSQPALPITVAHRTDTWTRPLARITTRIVAQLRDGRLVQWGGPVGLRSDVPPAAGALFAAELGLSDPGHAWHTDRTPLVDIADLLSRLTGACGKIGQDMALMAQAGPDCLVLSGGGGSSAMAHKQNPILAELLVSLARYNAGQVALMHGTLVHEQERSGMAWAVEWMVLPAMAQAAGRALTATLDLLSRIQRIGSDESPLHRP